MRESVFYLSISERGACEGFSSEDADRLNTHNGAWSVVRVEMPLPVGADLAAITVTNKALHSLTTTAEAASAWLALDDEGSFVAYAGEESALPTVREAADRYRRDSGLDISVVRIDVPLPAGSASAQISPI
jgi:hypothetical protein